MESIVPSKLKVAELRDELRKRGLSTAGLKPFLVKRLEEALNITADASDSDEDEGITEAHEIEEQQPLSDDSDDSCIKKRKKNSGDFSPRKDSLGSSSSSDVSVNEEMEGEIRRLSKELVSSQQEREKLLYQLEEAREKMESVKLFEKREIESSKESAELRTQLNTAVRKREELEFKLSQKDDEIKMLVAGKQVDAQESQQVKAMKEEIKKMDKLKFQMEQMTMQLDEYKQQSRVLQQKVETMSTQLKQKDKERDRLLNEERAKTEQLRIRMETQRDELVKEWRGEYAKENESLQEQLRTEAATTRKTRKEYEEKTRRLDDELASRTQAELKRLSALEGELRKQEKLQDDIQDALAQRQRAVEDEEARIEAERAELDEKAAPLERERRELDERLWEMDKEAKRRMEREKTIKNQIEELMTENSRLKEALSRAAMPAPPTKMQIDEPCTPVHSKEIKPPSRTTRSARPSLSMSTPSVPTLPLSKKDESKTTKRENKENTQPTPRAAPTSERKSMIPVRRGSSLLPSQIKAYRD